MSTSCESDRMHVHCKIAFLLAFARTSSEIVDGGDYSLVVGSIYAQLLAHRLEMSRCGALPFVEMKNPAMLVHGQWRCQAPNVAMFGTDA